MNDMADRIGRGRRAVQIAKRRGLDTSDWERRLKELLAAAGNKPEQGGACESWMLWEWRRVSIPKWQEILQISIEDEDRDREQYARWMLHEILLDPDYEEDQS